MTTLAFDVYGTLIDTAGVTTRLQTLIGDRAPVFSDLWRQKQLEYTWRYGLMNHYRNFRVCTSQALDFCCDQFECDFSAADKAALMQRYLELPAFDDVMDGLQDLSAAGVRMYAFSNGVPQDLESLLAHAGIDRFLDGTVSVDPKQTFKPNPVVYQHFCETAGSAKEDTWLVSSNGFDVCGGVAFGMRAAWLQRNTAIRFDHWPEQPTQLIHRFTDLIKII